MTSEFCRTRHVKFFERILDGVPGSFASQETNLMTIVYFCVSGLDLLDASDSVHKRRESLRQFIYSLQCSSPLSGGYFGNLSDARQDICSSGFLVGPSMAMTFAALSSLLVLGDDLDSVNREGIIKLLRVLQADDGSFRGAVSLHRSLEKEMENFGTEVGETEADMRFVFCASAISFIINDWSGVDVPKMLAFIWNSQTYEGGFAQVPGAESHGGSTYCAVAALHLVFLARKHGKISKNCDVFDRMTDALFSCELPDKDSNYRREILVRWCISRQRRGFTGRPNKPEDSCYTFWIGAALKLLGQSDMIDGDQLREFCLEAQDNIMGGFAKWPNTRSDPMHAYLCISGLSLLSGQLLPTEKDYKSFPTLDGSGDEGALWSLKPVHPALNISISAFMHLVDLQTAGVKQYKKFAKF